MSYWIVSWQLDTYINVTSTIISRDLVNRRKQHHLHNIAANDSSHLDGPPVAQGKHMTYAVATDRVRAEFIEMPGLELTLPQAVRLWGLGADDCRGVIDALVESGFLKWTTRRTIIRTSYKDVRR